MYERYKATEGKIKSTSIEAMKLFFDLKAATVKLGRKNEHHASNTYFHVRPHLACEEPKKRKRKCQICK